MSADWLEVTIQAHLADVEMLENWLFEAGALSVTLRDGQGDDDLSHAVLEPVPGEVRLWAEVTLVGLFSRDTSPEALHDALYLSAAALSVSVPPHQISHLGEREWTRTWLDSFRPMQFGEQFWVCPTEYEAPDKSATVLRLDPGLAFGTGTHATTSQCLAWLGQQTSAQSLPLSGQLVMDYGCGSGILAIAALLLGAEKAWAVDIDEQALQATRANALLNDVSRNLLVGQPDLVKAIQVDVLFANILFQPLMDLADVMAAGVKPGGTLVLSGILEEQMEPLRLRYNRAFDFDVGQSKDGWALLTAKRR